MQALARDDSLRRLLLREPRGSVAVHANLVVPPTRPDCAAGYIIMEPTEYPAMSGSNTICVATVLLETGMVEMREPETSLRLEAPAGVVEVTAGCREGKCEWVELDERPLLRRQARRPAGGRGARVARGGRRFRGDVVRDRRRRGARLLPGAVGGPRPVARGERIREAAREQLPCVHPENPEIAGVSIVEIAEPWRGIGAVSRNAVVVAPGRLDRSATGTGLSARMATLHGRGLMRAGDAMTHASVLGSTFEGRIVSETEVGGRPAIVPAIRGSAWITGITQVIVDPTDPFPEGYLLTDTWGVSVQDTQ